MMTLCPNEIKTRQNCHLLIISRFRSAQRSVKHLRTFSAMFESLCKIVGNLGKLQGHFWKSWGAYHLTENFGNSGWKVNGKVTFRNFQPKIEEYVLG